MYKEKKDSIRVVFSDPFNVIAGEMKLQENAEREGLNAFTSAVKDVCKMSVNVT